MQVIVKKHIVTKAKLSKSLLGALTRDVRARETTLKLLMSNSKIYLKLNFKICEFSKCESKCEKYKHKKIVLIKTVSIKPSSRTSISLVLPLGEPDQLPRLYCSQWRAWQAPREYSYPQYNKRHIHTFWRAQQATKSNLPARQSLTSYLWRIRYAKNSNNRSHSPDPGRASNPLGKMSKEKLLKSRG